MTYKLQGTGPCLSYDDVRLRNEAAAVEAARAYPSTDLSKPNPAAISAYRAARERLNADLAAMPVKCQVEFALQVATMAKHLVLHDRQVYLSKDGRHTLISAGPGDLSDPRLADTGDGYDIVGAAINERTNAEQQYGSGNAWGTAMRTST